MNEWIVRAAVLGFVLAAIGTAWGFAEDGEISRIGVATALAALVLFAMGVRGLRKQDDV